METVRSTTGGDKTLDLLEEGGEEVDSLCPGGNSRYIEEGNK